MVAIDKAASNNYNVTKLIMSSRCSRPVDGAYSAGASLTFSPASAKLLLLNAHVQNAGGGGRLPPSDCYCTLTAG